VIAGKGPEKLKLQGIIKARALEKNVTFTGELPYPEVVQLMRRAKVFLHPSSYEGFSGVCLEALAGGAHVISFCNPMNTVIPHWHVVNNNQEMINAGLNVLKNNDTEHEPVMPYSMSDTVKKMMSLFMNEEGISVRQG
jgi:glycosyltransferase involved in cell wall biosynthesis